MVTAIARKWTEKEKKLMADVSSEIYTLLKKRFNKDLIMAAQTLAFLSQGFNDEVGFEKIRIINKKGKADTIQEEIRVRKIVEGMKESDMNLILFRDSADVWMQYYMGIYLRKPTYLIVRNSDADRLKGLRKYALDKGTVYVSDFNKSELELAMKQIQKMMKDGI